MHKHFRNMPILRTYSRTVWVDKTTSSTNHTTSYLFIVDFNSVCTCWLLDPYCNQLQNRFTRSRTTYRRVVLNVCKLITQEYFRAKSKYAARLVERLLNKPTLDDFLQDRSDFEHFSSNLYDVYARSLKLSLSTLN